jgi:hypothetical protein
MIGLLEFLSVWLPLRAQEAEPDQPESLYMSMTITVPEQLLDGEAPDTSPTSEYTAVGAR